MRRLPSLACLLGLFCSLSACSSSDPSPSDSPAQSTGGESQLPCNGAVPCDDPCVGAACNGTGGSDPNSGTGGSPPLEGKKDIAVSPPSGTFEGSVSVTLEGSRVASEIRYTIDGTPVLASSPLYDGAPLVFSETTELRAQVFVEGNPVGEEAMAWYIARDFDVSVDLPIMVLDSYGAPAPDREYIDAAFMIFETPGTSISGAPTVASRAGFHLRGQSTAMFEKPPYRVELRDGSILFTKHDTDLGHLRRYTQRSLQDKLNQVGLHAKLKGGLFTSLLLPRSLSKITERLRGHQATPRTELEAHVETEAGTWSMGEFPTWCIKTILEIDARVGLFMAKNTLPIPGLSVWSISGKE